MTFLNRYTGNKIENNYSYSKEFVEGGKRFVLAVGQNSESKGIVTCINPQSGDVIWEKAYWHEEIQGTVFRKIIQVKNEKVAKDAYQYILLFDGVDKGAFFISINISGDFFWVKRVDFKFENYNNIFLESSYDLSEFYFSFSKYGGLQNNTVDPAFIGKFDQEGNLIIERYILIDSEHELVINDMTARKEGVTLVGSLKIDGKGYINAVIVDFDKDLKQQADRTVLVENKDVYLSNVLDVEGKLLVAGRLKENLFFSIIDDFSTLKINLFPASDSEIKDLMYFKNGIYGVGVSSSGSGDTLYHLDWEFNPVWIKSIDIDGSTNLISVTNNQETEKITATVYNRSVLTLISSTDESFDNCKTKEHDKLEIHKDASVLKGINVNLKDSNYEVKNLGFKKEDTKPIIKEYCPLDIVDLKNSRITVVPDCILPSGGQSTVTVQLIDTNGNIITNGSNTVVISTTLGNISGTTNNSDGTYTAILTATTPGNASLSFSVNGNDASATANVIISKDCGGGSEVDLDASTITTNVDCVKPNGTDQSTVTVQLVDTNGNLITNGNNEVVISTSLGTITSTTNNNDGTYTAVLTSTISGTATLSFTVNGSNATQTTTVSISSNCGQTPGEVDLDASTISASPTCILPFGNQSIVTVQLVDINGNLITDGSNEVEISSSLGNISGTTNNNDGTYTATLTSVLSGLATLSFIVNGDNASQTAYVTISSNCEDTTEEVDLGISTITANPDCILPNEGQSTITVQLIDGNGNLITNGGNTVIINTSFGSISGTLNNGDGTYTAILTSSFEGDAVLSFTVNGDNATQTASITISPTCDTTGIVDLDTSTITANPTCILPANSNTTNESVITVQLIDTNGSPINNGSNVVVIDSTFGIISSTTNNNNGSYTAVLSSMFEGDAILSFTVNGHDATQTVTVTISSECNDTNEEIDIENSTIIASPNEILADGTSTSTITLTLLNGNGNPVDTNDQVTIIFANGVGYAADLNTFTVVGNGVYTSILLSANGVEELVVVGFTINGVEATGNVATVNIYQEEKVPVDITTITSLQSPNFYAQAAGSTGDDSTKGIHLRWIFSGSLGDKHLPKGNYATNNFNFNKTEGDFVKVYRAPYQKNQFLLDFNLPPQVVNDSQRLWVYKFNNDTRKFFVHFKNSTKYFQVRQTIDPLANPSSFIHDYGDEIIEIDNKRELFFACEIEITNNSGDASIQTEALSVSENIVFVPKQLSFRKTFSGSDLNNVRLVSENGRSIRFKTSNCNAFKLYFEFYSDFIESVNQGEGWLTLGDYALTLENSVAYNLLEPSSDIVNGNWLRYNDEAYVNVANYQHKWNGPVEPWNKNIKEVVETYIELSDAADNPTAVDVVNINFANQGGEVITEADEGEETGTEISFLDMLRITSYDYHMARMLGLGFLDWGTEVYNGEYIYIAEYFTDGDLEDGLGPRPVQHLSMSLPTSINTQRLPLPVELKELLPGLPSENDDTQEDFNLTDEEGYSFDGKKRYISIYSEDLLELENNPEFYSDSDELDVSSLTIPVYAGLEYRHHFFGESDNQIWDKPELSHEKLYLNIDATTAESYETVHILVPEDNNELYVHRQSESGTHYYGSYGINWFSRAVSGSVVLNIDTLLKPTNTLKPPSNVNAYLVRPESPLMFSSQNDQLRLGELNNDNDKTLIRLSFDYHSHQELVNYQIPIDSALPDSVYMSDPTTLYPDDDEIFAEHIEIFFRNFTPKTITAKAIGLEVHGNPLLHIIKTGFYFQASTGETLLSEYPENTTEANFVGSIFLMGDQQFIIHSIAETTDGLDFTVYKQQISDTIMTGDVPDANAQNLITPIITGDGYFTVVENMQNTSNWGESTNPHSLSVKVNTWEQVHRELIVEVNDSGQANKYIEKTRGVWQDATIEPIIEEFQFQAPGTNVVQTINGPRGLYKITFNNFDLPQHEQFFPKEDKQPSVEWNKGVVRLFTESIYNNGQPKATRKIFNVFRTQHIGESDNNLVLYINDPNFQLDANGNPSSNNDEIIIGNNVLVNYYPGYKVYLYHDVSKGLTEDIILPDEEEGNRNSIFGLRSVDENTTDINGTLYKSKFSVPAIMFAQELIEAMPPEQPKGAKYATRPDFFGRSTYTITTKYQHKPYGVLFYRADNQAFLNALFSVATVKEIKENLKQLGGNEEQYFANRWENFLNFIELEAEGVYKLYPPDDVSEVNYRLPLPNKERFFDNINTFIQAHNDYYNANVSLIDSVFYGTLEFDHVIIAAVEGQNSQLKLIDFVKQAIENTFVSLNEVPIIYNHIESNPDYVPVNEKQNIRDENGYLLTPEDSTKYKMAPMMKIVGDNPHETYYTDFNLDGASDNIYFYAAKELSSQMKMSAFSPILGPVKLVNTNPPEAPKIMSALPVLQNQVLGIQPNIALEVNSYSEIQNIKKIKLYRALNRLSAESIQSMKLVKEINVSDLDSDSNIWKFNDDFSDLEEVPYREQLYYRVTALREVQYAKANYSSEPEDDFELVLDYAPSKPSKLIATMITEVANPPSPILSYFSEPIDENGDLHEVTLSWEKTCYRGKYHLYKMSKTGVWEKIYDTPATNNQVIYLPISLAEGINTNTLNTLNSEGKTIYHHFKVIAENTSGMFSTEEHILTIYNENEWQDLGGISSDGTDGMIIEGTFIVRSDID